MPITLYAWPFHPIVHLTMILVATVCVKVGIHGVAKQTLAFKFLLVVQRVTDVETVLVSPQVGLGVLSLQVANKCQLPVRVIITGVDSVCVPPVRLGVQIPNLA